MSYVLRLPDGTYLSHGNNIEKYGPRYFDQADGERIARRLEADYEWPAGSVELCPDWEAE